MKAKLSSTFRNITLVLSVIVLTTQLAEAARLPRVEAAQADAAAQAAAQATANTQQAAQQANAQAMADAQAASAQATANAQAAAANSTQSVPAPIQRSVQAPLAPNAPIPTQIATAHTVFLTSAGADANFPVDETQAYNQVYAALQAWGHFQFVTSPAQADLIFQLHDIAPITQVTGSRGGVYSISSPAFELTILDAKTNTPLWTVTSPVPIAGGKSARAKWFALSVTNLVSRVKVLANQPLTATETADLTTAPKTHGGLGLLLILGLVGVGIGGGFLLKHEFDKSVQQQNAALCAQNPFFCTNP